MAVGRALETGLPQVVAEYYPGMGVSALERTGRGLFLVPGTRLAVKVHSPSIVPVLDRLEAVYRSVNDSGLVPAMRLSRGGSLLNATPLGVISVQEYMPSGEFDPVTMAATLGRTLAGLHAALRKADTGPLTNHLQRETPDMEALARQFGHTAHIPLILAVESFADRAGTQLVHGDLHAGNVLADRGRVLFIDLDSAGSQSVAFDLAFCAYRILGALPEPCRAFVEAYGGHATEPVDVPENLYSAAAYMVLQRLLFIEKMCSLGASGYDWDLDNQKRYLAELDSLAAEGLSPVPANSASFRVVEAAS